MRSAGLGTASARRQSLPRRRWSKPRRIRREDARTWIGGQGLSGRADARRRPVACLRRGAERRSCAGGRTASAPDRSPRPCRPAPIDQRATSARRSCPMVVHGRPRGSGCSGLGGRSRVDTRGSLGPGAGVGAGGARAGTLRRPPRPGSGVQRHPLSSVWIAVPICRGRRTLDRCRPAASRPAVLTYPHPSGRTEHGKPPPVQASHRSGHRAGSPVRLHRYGALRRLSCAPPNSPCEREAT
jgi:hypothetical protein